MDYFHAKSGVLTDANGDQVAFTEVSMNPKQPGRKNYESFWFSFRGMQLELIWLRSSSILNVCGLTKSRTGIALDIPRAVKERLLKYRPPRAPTRDPLEPRTCRKSDER